jgi:hypothetical protein
MLGIVAVAGFGCSNTVSKADFKAELDKAGIGSSADTQCIVDKMEAKGFTFKKYGEVSSDDQRIITEATTECIKIDIPSISTPSIPGS